MICSWSTPAAAPLSTGRSERLTMPALVSKVRLPSERLAIVVVPETASTEKAPVDSPPLSLAPMEKTPEFVIERSVVVPAEVEEEMAKSRRLVSPLFEAMVNFAHGVEVPMPILPLVGSAKLVDVAGNMPKRRLPILSWLLLVLAEGKNIFEP